MSDVKISVIMPSLNVKPFIEECIESVINQTLEDIEIICVDAGSTDGTLEIIDKLSKADSRIKMLHSDKKSYGHQMNMGISYANGEYIGIVETDDFIDENMYEKLYGLTDNATADIAKVNFYHYYNDSTKRKDGSKVKLPSKPFSAYDYSNILNGHPSIWAAIYKKSFLKENNISFMEAPGGGWVDNPFLFQTMLAAKSIVYNSEPFYYYREENPDSSSNNLSDLTLPMRRMMDNLDVLEEFSCTNENVINALYIRIFWHLKDVLTRDNFEEQKFDVLTSIYNVFKRLDENIVNKYFSIEDQKLFYKFSSPLSIIESVMSKEDYENLIRENDFLYSSVSMLENDNEKLIKENKDLSKSLEKIKGSKAFKAYSLFKKI